MHRIVAVDTLVCMLLGLAISQLYPAGLTSLLAGCAIFLVPNLFFAWCVFRYRGARQARQMAQAFHIAETVKFILTVLLFAWSFVMLPIHEPLLLFVAYALMWLVHQLATWQVVGRHRI